MIIKRDEAFRTVCMISTKIASGNVVGTGLFVSSSAGNGNIFGWIVTASHVAKDTNDSTVIIVSSSDGRAQKLPLIMFGPLSNWRHHPIADVSCFQVEFSDINLGFMRDRFIPFNHFNLKKVPVSRDFELTCIGFPKGLGTNGMFSPFLFRSYASSGFITYPRADTGINTEFFCLENPSVGGYSGCPVFDLAYETNGILTTTRGQTCCHGIMHGTLCDNTGGKIAMVTPSYFLKDIIDCC